MIGAFSANYKWNLRRRGSSCMLLAKNKDDLLSFFAAAVGLLMIGWNILPRGASFPYPEDFID
jgi:hypothetical protein